MEESHVLNQELANLNASEQTLDENVALSMDSPDMKDTKEILNAFVLIDDLMDDSSPELPKTKTIKLKPNLQNQELSPKKFLRKKQNSLALSNSLVRKGSVGKS